MKEIPFDPKKSIIPAFMTPIGTFKVPGAADLNPLLESEILSHMQSEVGMTRSNVGGWHSNDDLFKWTAPGFPEFAEWVHAAVLRMISLGSNTKRFKCQFSLAGWANVNGPGQYNANHNHPGCIWSGVYYVRAGAYDDDPLPKAGQLQFYDPRGSVNMIQHPGRSIFNHAINIRPTDGLLVIFPAWLYHSVNPFMSDIRRISIAFNVQVGSFEAASDEPQVEDKEVAVTLVTSAPDAIPKGARKKAPKKSAASAGSKKRNTRKATAGG